MFFTSMNVITNNAINKERDKNILKLKTTGKTRGHKK